MNLAKRIPTPNLRIPIWLLKPMEPQDKIAWRQFGVLVDFNHIDRYFKRLEEIVYEVSEEMFYYP